MELQNQIDLLNKDNLKSEQNHETSVNQIEKILEDVNKKLEKALFENETLKQKIEEMNELHHHLEGDLQKEQQIQKEEIQKSKLLQVQI